MHPKIFKAAVAAAGAIASAQSAAAPITISETIAMNSLMNSNSTTVGFNLNAFLASQGRTASNVVGGHVIVHGFSEASYAPAVAGAYSDYFSESATVRGVTGSYYQPGYYSCGGWGGGCYYDPGYTGYFTYTVVDSNDVRYRDMAHIDAVADSLTVSVGGSSNASIVTSHSSSDGEYGAAHYDGQICPTDYYGNCGRATLYSRERDTYNAVFGALESTVLFDAAALADLRSDGMLDIGLFAFGQFGLDSISFVLDVEASDPNAVPEPASLILLSAGAGALAMTRRKRKK